MPMKILLLGVLFISAFTMSGDFWWPKWIILEICGSGLLSYLIYRRYGLIPALSLLWPLIGAILIFGDQTVLQGSDGSKVLAIENVVLKATIGLLLTVLPIAFAKKEWHSVIEEGLAIACFIDSLIVIGQFFIPNMQRHGFLGNPSMNGCFIALAFPYLALKPEQIGYAFKPLKSLFLGDWSQIFIDTFVICVCVLAVFLSQSTIPIITFAAVLAGYFMNTRDYEIKNLKSKIYICLLILSAMFICGVQFIPNFFADSGRFITWKYCLKWWWDNASILNGTGNGTFFHVGPVVQEIYNINVYHGRGGTNYWIWAHNDWLQTLIEQGLVGLVLSIALFISAAIRSWLQGCSYEFAVLMGLGVAAFFNFPVHQAPIALLGINCLARIFDLRRLSGLEFD